MAISMSVIIMLYLCEMFVYLFESELTDCEYLYVGTCSLFFLKSGSYFFCLVLLSRSIFRKDCTLLICSLS